MAQKDKRIEYDKVMEFMLGSLLVLIGGAITYMIIVFIPWFKR